MGLTDGEHMVFLEIKTLLKSIHRQLEELNSNVKDVGAEIRGSI